MVPSAVIAGRVEKTYIAFVSFSLGAAGTALGFVFGVMPYFRTADAHQYDFFFSACMLAGALAGFAIGATNAPRWFRAGEASPLIQRRMLAYLHRRGLDGRGVPQRTLVVRGSHTL